MRRWPLANSSSVTSLVETSNPFLLAYSLPLLLLSIVIAFSGTFLTLDRTRTFAPRDDRDAISTSLPSAGTFNVEKKARALFRKFRLDGGLGGIAVGYVFGCEYSKVYAYETIYK